MSQHKNIKSLMDETYESVSFDKVLYQNLRFFRVSWGMKDVGYVNFLNGNLLGTYPLRFSTLDDDILFNDVIQVDIYGLRDKVIKIHGINKDWKVQSNPILLSLVYFMHRFKKSKLSNKLKTAAITECYLIYSYKVLGSLYFHYFKYDVDVNLAKTTYERLSNKFLIKQLGSWSEVLSHRANDVIDGLHKRRIDSYSTEDAVRVVADLQGRIRDMIKNIYSVMMDVVDSEDIIRLNLSTTEIEGSVSLTEVVDRGDKYIGRLNHIIPLTSDFIDDDLVYLIKTIVKNVDVVNLRVALEELSKNYLTNKKLKTYVEITVKRTIAYNNTKGINNNYQKNILMMLNNMRGYWVSSSVNDKEIKLVKNGMYKLIKSYIKKNTRWVVATTVVAVLLYVFVRSVRNK